MKTLAFFHGWGASGTIWRRQAEAFGDNCLVFTPDIAAWEPEWFQRYLAGLSLTEAVLVGWSLGGMLLAEVLSRNPGLQPRALVLVGVAAYFCRRDDHPWGQPAGTVRAMRRALRGEPQRVLAEFAETCLAPGEAPFGAEARAAFQPPGSGENLAAGLDCLLRQDLRDSLCRLPPGGAIIQGEADAVVPPAQAQYLHQRLPGSRLYLLKGAGHLPFMTQGAAFSQILRKILGEGSGS
jgi:pimeloyl-[acyl-carrier protein] methyl ester esterase